MGKHSHAKIFEDLKKYISSTEKSVSLCISCQEGETFSLHPFDIYSMHSVGKVFTGVLLLLMVQRGIIDEKALNRPIKFKKEIEDLLPEVVINHLSNEKITLHQLMTHKANLGDYVKKNYIETIKNRIQKNESLSELMSIKNPEDFLSFAEPKIYKNEYSNLGILLVSLAIQEAYQQKMGAEFTYNHILFKLIINEIGFPSFSLMKPESGRFNKDPSAAYSQYLVGSPSGGYWINSLDLLEFGRWLYKKSTEESDFKIFLEKYGQEFYDSENQIIAHAGALPPSSAYFYVSLKTGNILVTLSDQRKTAWEIAELIIKKFFSCPTKES